jgi:hypothetical protein
MEKFTHYEFEVHEEQKKIPFSLVNNRNIDYTKLWHFEFSYMQRHHI